MRTVYDAADITEAHILSGLLKARDIQTYIGGYYLQGGIGELATMDFITIQVDEKDLRQALEIIAEYENSEGEQSKPGMEKKPVPYCSLYTKIFVSVLSFTFIMIILLLFSVVK